MGDAGCVDTLIDLFVEGTTDLAGGAWVFPAVPFQARMAVSAVIAFCGILLGMNWSWQSPRWRDAECLGAALVAGAGTLAVLKLRLPSGWAPRCPLKFFTGVPCLTCGGSRALRALLSGNVGAAFRLQPLLTVLAIAAVVWLGYAILGALFGLPRVRVQMSRRGKIALIGIAALAALANWVYLIAAGR